MTVLFLSNGHGEDTVGAAIAIELQKIRPEIAIEALPLVGCGAAYSSRGISVVGPRRPMPSGGFIIRNPKALTGDVFHGLLSLTAKQLLYLKKNRSRYGLVVGVGDALCIYMNWLCLHRPMTFMAIADSMYYCPTRPKPFTPFVRNQMKRFCRAIFTRDEFTAKALMNAGIKANYLGNPMMDSINFSDICFRTLFPGACIIGILPGSRQDAQINLIELMKTAIMLTRKGHERPYRFLVAWPPTVAFERNALGNVLQQYAETAGIIDSNDTDDGPKLSMLGDNIVADIKLSTEDRLTVLKGHFGDILRDCELVVGLSGTGNEQAAGMGKPVVIFEGPGAQITRRFVKGQRMLLGEAVRVSEPDPALVADAVVEILTHPEIYDEMSQTGRKRMGCPGASRKIAENIAGIISE